MSLERGFVEVQRYVRWTDGDLQRLRAFAPLVEPRLSDIARTFYERTREFEEAHNVFTGEEQIARLQRSLVGWMRRVLTRERDLAYCRETATIGHVHVKVGLHQRYIFAAMTVVREELCRAAGEVVPLAEVGLTRRAIDRALDIELAVMTQAYNDDHLERIRRAERLARDDLGRALARSERRYENAVELAPDLVLGLGSNGTILLFNRSAEKVTGWARDEACLRAFTELMIREDHRQKAEEAFARTRHGVAHLSAPLVTRAGNVRLVHWYFSRIPDDGATADDVSLLAIGRDVTDEEALSQRTRQAEKLAAVGTLAAGLAHEIRNPLNGAQLHLTFLERELRKKKVGGEAIEAVEVVGGEIRRLGALVQEFLDFARPKPLERTRGSLSGLARKAVTLARSDKPGVSLELDLPTTDIELDLDGNRMMQVLLNLLSNAIDAVGDHGRVVVRVRRRPAEAVLEVEDDGPGLPGGDAAPVFDAFYTTKSHGTGLGLAIVHRIVTDHGGSIGVQSKKGQTIFRATLPLSGEGITT